MSPLFWKKSRHAVSRPDLAVIGLGNPGREYARTRHNVGFMCVDYFAKKHAFTNAGKKGLVAWTEGVICSGETGKPIVLVKPRTFMNLSGEAVKYLVDRWHLTPGNLLIIYDELALPLGKIRIRPSGSSAGHNGIQSIINALGTDEVPRIRVGIGPQPGEKVEDNVAYVLGMFSHEEREVLGQVVPRVSQAIEAVISKGLRAAMDEFN